LAQTVPVVASGGIGNGKGIARALSIGASGAMLGTRFVATQESLAHELYKRRLVEAKTEDAVLTVCFDLGWPYAAHRVLGNSTLAIGKQRDALRRANVPAKETVPRPIVPAVVSFVTSLFHSRRHDWRPRGDVPSCGHELRRNSRRSLGERGRRTSLARVRKRIEVDY